MIRCVPVAIVLALSSSLLGGCSGAPAKTAVSMSSRTGSVNVAALVGAHPFATTLQAYDREIETLRATQAAPPIERAAPPLQRHFDGAAAQLQAVSGKVAGMLDERERTAAAALRNGIRASGGASVDAQIESNYRRQYAAVHRDTAGDMAAYRQALLREQQTALATYARALDRRTQRAYAARSQEFSEREAGLALRLAQADAGKRLRLRVRLQNLYLDARERAALRGALDALDRQETRALDAQRRSDSSTLAAVRAQLQAQAASDSARRVAQMQAQAAANLETRQAVSRAQSGVTASLPADRGVAAASDLAAKIESLRQSGTDLSATIAAFGSARADLLGRFTTLADAESSSRRDVAAEIVALRHERQAVRDEIVAQIMRYAQMAARERGLGAVYPAREASRGSVDLTPEVRRDLARLSR